MGIDVGAIVGTGVGVGSGVGVAVGIAAGYQRLAPSLARAWESAQAQVSPLQSALALEWRSE